MEFYDWLLFLHVLSAFIVVAALTALWGLVLATRPEAPAVSAADAIRLGRNGGLLVAIGMGGTIVFGIWLALIADRYEIWDAWIVASLVLWALAGWLGDRTGRVFAREPVDRRTGILLHAGTSLAVIVILVLMIWKPGA